jgi:hypothetical protein
MNFNVLEVHTVNKLTKSKLVIQSQPLDHGGIYIVNPRQSQNQQLGEGMCTVFQFTDTRNADSRERRSGSSDHGAHRPSI